MKPIILKTTIAAATVWMLSGCGGGQQWGIDHGSIPTCNADRHDMSAAIQVPAGTQIAATQPHTVVRVWHYSNADKFACVLSGSASIGGAK